MSVLQNPRPTASKNANTVRNVASSAAYVPWFDCGEHKGIAN